MRSIRTGVTLNSAVIPEAILEVVRTLHAAGHQAFLVGGCVRDMMRGAKPKDFDIASSALPAQVQKAFRRVIPTGIQHGTVTVLVGDEHIEVTTFRSEGDYVDGRRPETVEFHTDIEADLARRDFTINAMALDPFTQRLVDPFEGHKDLEARTIRCVRSALERFTEDGLRCLRAVRFATVLDFSLDPLTEAAIAPTLSIFKKVAIERVREELQKILLSPNALRGLNLLKSTGLLDAFLPEAGQLEQAAAAAPDLEVRFAVLLAAAPKPQAALERLKLPTHSIKRAAGLIAHQQPPDTAADDKVFRLWIRDTGVDALDQQLAVCAALGRPVDLARVQKLRHDPLVPKQLALDGAQIMAALDTRPGPVVGQATRFLMDQVLSDPSKNTVETLTVLLAGFPR